VNGTVNDLASPAQSALLERQLILEEGFPSPVAAIVEAMAQAGHGGREDCYRDTKVVERGTATAATSIRGRWPAAAGITVGPHRAQPGDAILVSGTIAITAWPS